MNTLQFKVTLLSDVIINQRAATEGNQKTLDFITGNAFLGVAAGELYENTNDETFTLFHSGKVRFGDAHPLVDNKRALKVPASLFFPKGEDKSKLFVHHGMPKPDENKIDFQPKQCRDSFVVKTTDNTVIEVEIKKHFAIKSAYDSDKRRSEDAKMYGYESLQAGSEWCFEVVFNDDVAAEIISKVENSLVGKKRVGRSSTAQYGLVKIEKVLPFENGFHTWPQPKTRDKDEKVVFVYAENRLIFFDQYGQPTFNPTGEQLGIQGGKICWEMSQIRTFQYSPYNNHRKTRDTDRCGIEKGSVFCVTGTTCSETENWVGSYQNEGFGKVLINPEFLEYTDDLGKAKYAITSDMASHQSKLLNSFSIQTNDTPVLNYLTQQKLYNENQQFIYEQVNSFVKNNERNFKEDSFASQWGTIRSLATQIKTKYFNLNQQEQKDLLLKKLFEEKDDPVTHKKIGIGYLKHGVAAEKWEYKSKDLENEIKKIAPEIAIEVVINLAAEMAKKCRRD